MADETVSATTIINAAPPSTWTTRWHLAGLVAA
jgi:hypothetical protein